MRTWRRTAKPVAPTPISDRARRLHQLLPGYTPTALRECPTLARAVGVSRLWVKDESDRLGLPAYKALGGVWAVCRMCSDALGRDLSRCASWEEIVSAVEPLAARRLVTATDGNHGRGVARVAKWFGFACTVHVPGHTVAARVEAIAGEGAEVVEHEGDYDDAVRAAVADAGADSRAWLVQDTVVDGKRDAARWCAEGYVTIFSEIDEALQARGEAAPDVLVLPIGVGTLASAMIRCVRHSERWSGTLMLGVEPENAACALASLEAGEMRPATGDGRTIMAGLNCPTVSPEAWPTLRDGLDACVAIEDAWSEKAMRLFAQEGVTAGETGAAGLASLLAVRENGAGEAIGLHPGATALVLNTEGATDPAMYARIVGG